MRQVIGVVCAVLGLLSVMFTSAARGQVGVKGMIQHQLDNSVDQHNQDVDNALNQGVQKPPAQPGEIKSGWLTRKSKDGKKDVRLYFAYPATLDAAHRAPGLLVIHENWGLNEEVRQHVEAFARNGIYAVAPDLFNGQVADQARRATQLQNSLSDADALLAMKTGLDLFDDEANNGVVDSKRVGVIGWSMGGRQALLLAMADTRVHATAIYYGPLVMDARRLSALEGPVLLIAGNGDTMPSPDDVNKFEQAMKSAGKLDFRIYRFDGVGRAFASKSSEAVGGGGGTYDQEKANEAWQRTLSWLNEKLIGKR